MRKILIINIIASYIIAAFATWQYITFKTVSLSDLKPITFIIYSIKYANPITTSESKSRYTTFLSNENLKYEFPLGYANPKTDEVVRLAKPGMKISTSVKSNNSESKYISMFGVTLEGHQIYSTQESLKYFNANRRNWAPIVAVMMLVGGTTLLVILNKKFPR